MHEQTTIIAVAGSNPSSRRLYRDRRVERLQSFTVNGRAYIR
jgi:hypothetical protein